MSSSFLTFFLFGALLFLCSSWKLGLAAEVKGAIESNNLHHRRVQVNSLLPSTTCKPSTKGPNRKASLTVVHQLGPCSQLSQDNAKAPTHAEILELDESRVKWINSRLSINLGTEKRRSSGASANIPAKSGATIGSANYVVTVGLGKPTKGLTLIFDTGSDLTWTQCEPCLGSCYKQKEPIFDPRKSKTYRNITCNSKVCSLLTSATGNNLPCSASTCLYGIQYGDQSVSVGFFAKERLALTPRDVFKNFLFGCGEKNQGLFSGAAGLIGLGRGPVSLVQQTAHKYGRFFSYCIPSSSSSTGHLTFGKSSSAISNSVQFTPFSKLTDGTPFYGLDTTGIIVEGRKLEISDSVFSDAGTIIDSGTVITRLPPAAYKALRTAFRDTNYQGPISVTIHVSDDEKSRDVLLSKLHDLYNGNEYMKQYVDVHLVVDNFERQFNMWRNVAKFFARTNYVMMLDVDFHPCTDFRHAILNNEEIMKKLRTGNTALVVPAFEYADLQEGLDYRTFPTKKADAIELVESGRLVMFHASWKPGHGPSNYTHWYSTNELYKVTTYQYQYEPYVIFPKQSIWCDERFVGYGANKAACLFELYLSGVDYWVLPNDFLIHQTHEYLEDARRHERRFNKKLYDHFREELCFRYARNFILNGEWETEKADNLKNTCNKIRGFTSAIKYFSSMK